MTQSIRDAARALYSACCNYGSQREQEIRDAVKAYELAALSAPQPTADERLERLLSDVEMYGHAHAVEARNDAFRGHESMAGRPQYDLPAMFAEIEQSARALLSASQEDAEHAAMYRWLVDKCTSGPLTIARVGTFELIPWSGDNPDAVIRAAMTAKETK